MKTLMKNMLLSMAILIAQFVVAQGGVAGGGTNVPATNITAPVRVKPLVQKQTTGGRVAEAAQTTAINASEIENLRQQLKTSEELRAKAVQDHLGEKNELKAKLGEVESKNRELRGRIQELEKGNENQSGLVAWPVYVALALLVVLIGLTVFGFVVLIKGKRAEDGVPEKVGEKIDAVVKEIKFEEKFEILKGTSQDVGRIATSVSQMKTSVDRLSTKLNPADFSKLMRVEEEMSQKVDNVLSIVKAERSAVESSQKEKDSEIAKLREENTRLKTGQAEATSKKNEADRLVRDVEREKAKAGEDARLSMQTQVVDAERKVVAANDEIKRLYGEIKKLEAQVLELKDLSIKAEQAGYDKAYLKSSEALRKALVESEQKFGELGKVTEQLRLLKEEGARAADEKRAALVARDQEHQADLQRKLAAQESQLKAEAERMKAVAVQAEKNLSTTMIERLSADVSARNEEIAQLEQTIATKEADLVSVRDGYAKLDAELKTVTASRDDVQVKLEALQMTVYPPILLEDADFIPLRDVIDGWIQRKCVGGEIARAALVLFASRNELDADGWRTALFNISVGISSAVRACGGGGGEVIAELQRWQLFLMKFRDAQHEFQLQIPVLGSPVDASWMTATNRGAQRVSNVLSWGIFNRFGIQNNALVE